MATKIQTQGDQTALKWQEKTLDTGKKKSSWLQTNFKSKAIKVQEERNKDVSKWKSSESMIRLESLDLK